MGVGFILHGTYATDAIGQSADDWLEQVAAWLESHEEEPLMLCRMGVNGNEQPTLFVQIHPCAEDVEFTVPDAGLCIVAAKTSTVGPGYHIFLCDLLHEFGQQFRIDWDPPDESGDTGDETGYFHDPEQTAVRKEMLHWLSAIARVVLENCQESEVGIRMVSMPLDCSYPDQAGILTPLGPRTPQWFERMVETPEAGTDFFPWWPEGVGAAFFLGRALCRMWQEIRWRTPITEDEGETLMDVHLDLERAFHLDPDCAIPWREWAELLGYLRDYFGYAEFQYDEGLDEKIRFLAAGTWDGDPPLGKSTAIREGEPGHVSSDPPLEKSTAIREGEPQRRQPAPGGPLIGYRRGRVQVTLTGGWSLTIAGEFAAEWEESGETWSAWHGGRTIWFTSWTVQGENDEPLPPRDILDGRPWPEDAEIIDHADGALLGRAVFLPHEEDGQTLWNLKGYSAVAGSFSLCNIYFQDRCDLAWALEVWKSLRN